MFVYCNLRPSRCFAFSCHNVKLIFPPIANPLEKYPYNPTSKTLFILKLDPVSLQFLCVQQHMQAWHKVWRQNRTEGCFIHFIYEHWSLCSTVSQKTSKALVLVAQTRGVSNWVCNFYLPIARVMTFSLFRTSLTTMLFCSGVERQQSTERQLRATARNLSSRLLSRA